MSDPIAAYERLRAETAQMLKLDAANLSLVEGLQLDLVSLLRLEVDGLQAAVLGGEQVDLARLSTAHTLLQKMLPAQALVAPAAAADHVDQFAGAREELSNFLFRRADNIARRDQRLEAEMAANPAKARAEASATFEAKLQAAIEKYNKTIPDPGGGDDAARDRSVPLPELSPLAAAGCVPAGHPMLIEPPPPPPPPPRRSMDEINAEPANPPAPPVEEWRRWVDSDGVRVSPWSGRGY